MRYSRSTNLMSYYYFMCNPNLFRPHLLPFEITPAVAIDCLDRDFTLPLMEGIESMDLGKSLEAEDNHDSKIPRIDLTVRSMPSFMSSNTSLPVALVRATISS